MNRITQAQNVNKMQFSRGTPELAKQRFMKRGYLISFQTDVFHSNIIHTKRNSDDDDSWSICTLCIPLSVMLLACITNTNHRILCSRNSFASFAAGKGKRETSQMCERRKENGEKKIVLKIPGKGRWRNRENQPGQPKKLF